MIKQRNIALCIVFSIITFGIYALYWFVCLTNDANQESGQTDATSGGVALLLTIVTCNIFRSQERQMQQVVECRFCSLSLHVTSMDGSGHIRWARKLIS